MSVLLAVPCYGGALTVQTHNSLCMIRDLNPGIDIMAVVGESAITRGRSNIAAAFMSEPFAKYKTLAMIDADIEIQAADFTKLVELDAPVRGAAVCLKTNDHSELLSCWKDGEVIKRADMPDHPFAVDYLGGAVMLIERYVLDKMYTDPELDELEFQDSQLGHTGRHLFMERILDGTLLSEDYSFCWLARAMGFPVVCHPGVVVTHYGQSGWRY